MGLAYLDALYAKVGLGASRSPSATITRAEFNKDAKLRWRILDRDN